MKPTNGLVNPLLTDLYQLTMAYAYWKTGRHEEEAVFDLFFRKNPFKGEFTIFAGLEEVLRFVENFRFTEKQINYLKEVMPGCDPDFFSWLAQIDCSEVKISAMKEGTIVFPREPLIRVEGPLAICQLLETTLLNLVNYASLLATNAARFRLAAGFEKNLLEFGLRRAQGPDGGISASRYSYIGGFDGTSNVLAGQIFGIPVKGTHAHAFVQSFSGMKDLKSRTIISPDGKEVDFVAMVSEVRETLGFTETNEGELTAFIAYAQAFPKGFLALVDTYDTLKSGVPNFLCVAIALLKLGYMPIGIRLDSGDLAYLSKEARKIFKQALEKCWFTAAAIKFTIVASNDINEEALHSLNEQGHEIDSFGVGTHLVTCQAQPALGCVYKLVEINGSPRIKLSQEVGKITIPGRKTVFRLYGKDNLPLIDVMVMFGTADPEPKPGEKIFCRHPFNETKRANVIPTAVKSLHGWVWIGGKVACDLPNIHEIRKYVIDQLAEFRSDYLRAVNPTPYKLAIDQNLYNFIHDLWMREAPITEMA